MLNNNKMDSRFNEKSYNKAKTVRKLLRDQMFQRSRRASMGSSYMTSYTPQMQSIIRASLEGPIPYELPPASSATRETISYYRRSSKPVFKTRMSPEQHNDLHMTFESLWCLAGIDDIQNYPNYQKVIKQFEDNLGSFLSMPYPQIRQMAVIAAGNKILGKQEDIMNIVNQDENQLWVLINHIYERKISYTTMYRYLNRNLPIIYRTIYEMSNHQKDEIIESIMKSDQILQAILSALNCGHPQIQLYSVRIVGNILAERDDYNQTLMKYQILDMIYPLLKSTSAETRKDVLWVLSNYICESAPANQVLCKPHLLEKLLMMFKNQQSTDIKIELYHVLSYLAYYGDPSRVHKVYQEENILDQCCYDIEIQNKQLTLIILSLISKLVSIGEEFVNDVQHNIGGRNPFIRQIIQSKLRAYIHSKTYSQNNEVSDVSFDIMNAVEEFQNNFGDTDDNM